MGSMCVGLGRLLGGIIMADEVAVQGQAPEGGSSKSNGKEKKHVRKSTKVIRFLEIYYGFIVLGSLAGLIVTSRDAIVYNLDTLKAFADVSFYSVAIMLFAKRMRVGRPFAIVVCCVDILFGLMNVVTGTWTIVTWLLNSLIIGVFIVYFATSKQVREVLVNDYSSDDARDVRMPKITEFAYWRNLAMYYCIFSVVGHWMEAGFCWLVSLGVVQGSVDFNNTELFRDWLYPFAIEGIGFCMCVLILDPLKTLFLRKLKNPLLALIPSFIADALVCASVELFTGLIANPTYLLWDYRPLPFNFMGQICLQNSVGFGIVSTIIVWVIYPFIERQFDKLSKAGQNILAGLIIAFFAVLVTLYMITLPTI